MSASGSTRPSGCGTPESSWQRTTWQIASVSRIEARNWLPSPSPSEAPLTRPAMSWKEIVAGTSSELRDRLRDPLQPLVGNLRDRDVRLDRRERVVAGLGAALGQRVEEGRLAGVRQPDDPDLHSRPS